MTIDFRISGLKASAEELYRGFVLAILDKVIPVLALPPEDVIRFIVADDLQYPQAIQEFSPRNGCTNDGLSVGTGKTLPMLVNGTYKGCVLVLRHCVLGALLTEPEAERADRPAGEADAMRYVLHHELGHCADYRRRLDQHVPKDGGTVTYVTRKSLAFAGALTSEFAACHLSATFLTCPAYGYECEGFMEYIPQLMKDLSEKHLRYSLRQRTLQELSDDALFAFWRCLMQYAKLIALGMGNAALGHSVNLDIRTVFGSQTAFDVLQKMDAKMKEAWTKYPLCTEAFSDLLLASFFALTESKGYKYEINRGQDYFWLR